MAGFFDLTFSEHYVFGLFFTKECSIKFIETSDFFIIGNYFVEEVTIMNQNIFGIVQGFSYDFYEVICVKPYSPFLDSF